MFNWGDIENILILYGLYEFGGIPCDYDCIFEIVERKKSVFKPANNIQEKLGRVAVVADAAHTFGAERHGQTVGSIADFTKFSLTE